MVKRNMLMGAKLEKEMYEPKEKERMRMKYGEAGEGA